MTNPLIVAVHGATGSQGRPVLDSLLARGHRIRALARDPHTVAGLPDVEPVPVDLHDPESLAGAYGGADAVVVQLPLVFHATRALEQAVSVATALEAAGARRVVFNPNTVLPAATVGSPFIDARVRLREALDRLDAETLTIGPAATYAENLLLPAHGGRAVDGVLAYPLPAEAPVPWLAAADLADQIADAVTSGETGVVAVAGPDALTGPETAAAVAGAIRRPLRWHTVTPAEYERLLIPALGREAAAGIAGMYAVGPEGPPAPDARVTLRMGTTRLPDWATKQDWHGAAPRERLHAAPGR